MSEPIDPTFWKKCSSCKKLILYKALYWTCNVSTCNRKRLALQFCSVSCWDAHLPMMNHRESWAIENRAPTYEKWLVILKEESLPKKRSRAQPDEPSESSSELSAEIPDSKSLEAGSTKPTSKVLIRRSK